MGYNVSILRKRGGVVGVINEEEVIDAAKNLPNVSVEAFKSGSMPWLKIAIDGDAALILACTGGVWWAKTPDDRQLILMISLAEMLGARVRGDDFETYRSVSQTFLHDDDIEERNESLIAGRHIVDQAKRRKWLLNGGIIAFFAILAAIVAKRTK